MSAIIATIILYGVFLGRFEKEAPAKYEEMGGASLYLWPPAMGRMILYMTRLEFLGDVKTETAKNVGFLVLAFFWISVIMFLFNSFQRVSAPNLY